MKEKETFSNTLQFTPPVSYGSI